ncbi:hypothetical protein [Oceanirhabdus sp. W0125-5]|uniref:hypothetical protein n=1 Tax=Oceanirhabdus sp. W0125-5 TaxID=2999116 RepID=UPI0022F31180|nr:hypothetical protein [Oceanirhabdus sp. W0125-5]WBW97259.1 hypothetical protein OW730_26760 [Oceanirhabdus sp. W0125-5]
MGKKEYLLDSNIVIKIWDKYPNLFEAIEKSGEIDFKIYNHIAAELSIKEYRKINGVSVLSDRFLRLLGHVINEDEEGITEIYKPNISIKHDSNKLIYYINGNKLSRNDYNLICICESDKQYTLVTEDKKILNSAKLILAASRVLTFNDFLNELKCLNVIEEFNK